MGMSTLDLADLSTTAALDQIAHAQLTNLCTQTILESTFPALVHVHSLPAGVIITPAKRKSLIGQAKKNEVKQHPTDSTVGTNAVVALVLKFVFLLALIFFVRAQVFLLALSGWS